MIILLIWQELDSGERRANLLAGHLEGRRRRQWLK
jgi:hypothetical protein